MTEVNAYTPGTFSWLDLSTTDVESAKTFYNGLFGWELVDNPAGPDSIYVMAHLRGKAVAGLFEQGKDQKSQGIPASWTSYVSVASADESAAKIKSQGGTIMVEPFDVMDAGRMAVLQDPTGAVFSIWEAKGHSGAHLVNEPGTLVWNELATNDTEKASSFYSHVFGWGIVEQDMGDFIYTSFKNGDGFAAGMMAINEDWGDVPPHWMVYFAVEDCDASAEKAQTLGGSITVAPSDIPGVGRFAMIQDPQGAHFSILKLVDQE